MARYTYDDVYKILTDPAVDRIRFTAGTVTVTPEGIKAVAEKFKKHLIALEYQNGSPGGTKRGQGIYEYHSDNRMVIPIPGDELHQKFKTCIMNAFDFADELRDAISDGFAFAYEGKMATQCKLHLPTTNDYDRATSDALILHEFIHAMFDNQKTSMDHWLNETCAYVSQFTYQLAKGDSWLLHYQQPANLDHFTLSIQIGNAILTAGKTSLTSNELKQFKAHFSQDPYYKADYDQPSVNDGIPD